MLDIKLINERIGCVSAAEKKLEESKHRRALLDFKGHQTDCTVSVMGVMFNLSYLDRETGWASTAIRGREMLILGAQKILNAEIAKAEEVLRKAEVALNDAVVGKA